MDFFYTRQGIGLTLIRLKIYPNLSDCNADESPGTCVSVGSGPTLSTDDLANAQAAVARGATVWAAEWSPPGSMKSNGSFATGGAMLNGAANANFTSLASIQAAFITLLTGTYHIPIYAISPQNEPDVSTSYPSCTWTAQQIHDYVPYLAAALASAGYSSTKIMIAEPGTWVNTSAATAMNDAAVAADVGILASHGYFSSASLLSYSNVTSQHQWETEVSDFSTYDGTITSGLTYATEIQNWLATALVNSWNYWELTCTGGCTDNEGLTDSSGNIAKRAYTFGNFSKFIRPGWHLVGVTNGGSLLVTAAQDSTNALAVIVVINNSGSAATNQAFSVGAGVGASFTPWITSASVSLAMQSPMSVSSGIVTYTIPADSVVTLTNYDPLQTSSLLNGAFNGIIY